MLWDQMAKVSGSIPNRIQRAIKQALTFAQKTLILLSSLIMQPILIFNMVFRYSEGLYQEKISAKDLLLTKMQLIHIGRTLL